MKQLTPGPITQYGGTTSERLHGIAEALNSILNPDYAEIVDHTQDEVPSNLLTMIVNDEYSTTLTSEVSDSMFRWKLSSSSGYVGTSYDIQYTDELCYEKGADGSIMIIKKTPSSNTYAPNFAFFKLTTGLRYAYKSVSDGSSSWAEAAKVSTQTQTYTMTKTSTITSMSSPNSLMFMPLNSYFGGFGVDVYQLSGITISTVGLQGDIQQPSPTYYVKDGQKYLPFNQANYFSLMKVLDED